MAADYYASLGKNLIGTKTFDNLMAAFAGESQARNKYTYFASKAKKDGYEQIAKIFLQTAENEKEHAKIWYKILEGVHSTVDNLEIAADGEHEESLKKSMKHAIASCLRTSRAALSSPKTATVSGNAATAATSSSAPQLPMYVLSAITLRPISSSTPTIIDPSDNY